MPLAAAAAAAAAAAVRVDLAVAVAAVVASAGHIAELQPLDAATGIGLVELESDPVTDIRYGAIISRGNVSGAS